MMKKIAPPLRHQRAYGVFIYGAHNISLLSEYFTNDIKIEDLVGYDYGFDFYHVLLTRRNEIAEDTLMLCGADEFDRICLEGFGDWQAKKWLKDEMETWETRPSKKVLKKIIKGAKLVDKYVGMEHNWFAGPDWFVFC